MAHAHTRRRPSVVFHAPLPPPPPPLALAVSPPPPPGFAQQHMPPPQPAAGPAEEQQQQAAAKRLLSRLRGLRQHRGPLPLPLLFMALGMGTLGGWTFATPALLAAGLHWWRTPNPGHTRRLSASGRARRASSISGSVAGAMLAATAAGLHGQPHRMRGRTASARVCCICLDAVAEDEPSTGLFDCKHDAQTHKACIEQWLERNESCPICRCETRSPALEQMRTQPDDAEAQLRGCRFVVLKGWQNEEYQRHLIELGAPQWVARALRAHAGHEELCAAACGAVFVLAFASREAQRGLAALGACEAVVQAMARFPRNAELQSRGCGAIYALALSNKETQAALCDAGAPGAVLRALRGFMADPSVAISAADAIMSLACDYRLGQDLLGDGDGEADGKGACELLAELVERYGQERDLMYAALDAVMKLAIDNPLNRLRFGRVDMCDRVLEGLERYHADETFLLVTLTALYTVAENQPENQHLILAGMHGQGATLLLATLEQHAANQDIASVGLDVLFALGYDAARGPNVQSLPILLQKGAPAFILRMLELYPQSPEIYGPGLKAAACLLTAPEAGRRWHGMTGGAWCRVVCESMAHALEARDTAVVEIACRVVGALALHAPETQRALRESGACRMVCECLRRGLGGRWEALEALADLAHNCPENRAALGAEGAVPLVVGCIERSLLLAAGPKPGAQHQQQQEMDMLDMGIVALTNVLQDDTENARRLAQVSKHTRLSTAPIPVVLARLLHAGAPPAPHQHQEEHDTPPTKERVCVYMMALSVICAADAEAQEQAGDAGACEALVGVLRALLAKGNGEEEDEEGESDDEEDEKALGALQGWRQGVQLLADLAAGHAGNQQRLREAGALELLVAALPRFFLQDALDAARWLLAVSVLAEGCPENQDRLMALGAAEIAMQLHDAFGHEEEALLDSALGALASLAANQRRHQDRVGALGACELVVRTVAAHPDSAHFLTRCCSVVLALSELERVDEEGNHLHIWKDASYNNKNRLRDAGAVAAFVRAIHRWAVAPDADPLIIGGLILSLALVAEDDAATNATLREQGIYDLLVRLLQQHLDNDALLTAAGGFVATVCVVFNDDWSNLPAFETPVAETQRAFLEGGTVDFVLCAMQRRPEDKGTLIMGFIALAALAWQNREGGARLLAALEGLDRLLAGIATRGPDVLFYGLMTLGAIVSFPVNDAAVVARCRPVIARWASRAEELYPSNQCLTRLRCLILAHLDGPSHDALSSSAKTPAGATTAAGAAHSATA